MPNFTNYEVNKALPGSFSSFDMDCLYPALKTMKKPDIYLEVGVQYGRSLAFARQFSKGRIFGIDIADDLFRYPDFKNKDVTFWHMSSDSARKGWQWPIKVLFIDGDHSYEGVKADWDNFAPHVVPGGWVFFHDCDNTSPGVERLFDEINGSWAKKERSPEQRCSMAWLRRA